jgi:hypothetical protein
MNRMIPLAVALSAAITLSPAAEAHGPHGGGNFGMFARSPAQISSNRPAVTFSSGAQRSTFRHFGNSFAGNRFNQNLGLANRNWNHGTDRIWNHHQYRWIGNSWLLIDPGYYDYSTPGTYAYNDDPGTNDSLVSDVQEALAGEGYYRGAIDGDLGDLTQNAIAAYQRDHRQNVTGSINTQLLTSLNLD